MLGNSQIGSYISRPTVQVQACRALCLQHQASRLCLSISSSACATQPRLQLKMVQMECGEAENAEIADITPQCVHAYSAQAQSPAPTHAEPCHQPSSDIQHQTNDMDPAFLLQQACSGKLYTHFGDPKLLPRLHAALHAALADAAALMRFKPPIDNAGRLHRRIRSDLAFLDRCLSCAKSQANTTTTSDPEQPPLNTLQSPAQDAQSLGQETQQLQGNSVHVTLEANNSMEVSGTLQHRYTSTASVSHGKPSLPMARALTAARIQGLVNNLRGYTGELLTAKAVPGLVALGKRFHTVPCHATPAPGSAHEQQVKARRLEIQARKRKQQQLGQQQPANLDIAHSKQDNQHVEGIVGPAYEELALDTGFKSGHQSTNIDDMSQHTATTIEAAELAVLQGEGCDAPADLCTTIIHNSNDTSQLSTQTTPHVVPPVIPSTSEDGASHPSSKPNNDSSSQQSELLISTEVDVVCCNGSVWLEIKNQERFGLDSEHWHSTKGSMKGLRRQVHEMLLCAAAPCNQVRWQAPHVVVLFPSGADPLVVAALKDMGATVVLDLADLPQSLPSPPPEPLISNIDTTTMCALVSEVTWAPEGDAAVAQWAARTHQWRQCVTEQAQAPIMNILSPYISPSRRLVAADVAVQQFDKLIEMHGGPNETARWHELRARLDVISTQGSNQDQAWGEAVSTRLLGLGSLREVGAQQVAVFGVGDALHAVTLTANGAAVRSAASQGVNLEAFIHRPVWLAGL